MFTHKYSSFYILIIYCIYLWASIIQSLKIQTQFWKKDSLEVLFTMYSTFLAYVVQYNCQSCKDTNLKLCCLCFAFSFVSNPIFCVLKKYNLEYSILYIVCSSSQTGTLESWIKFANYIWMKMLYRSFITYNKSGKIDDLERVQLKFIRIVNTSLFHQIYYEILF